MTKALPNYNLTVKIFFFTGTATAEIDSLSVHDAFPIFYISAIVIFNSINYWNIIDSDYLVF